MASSLDQSLRFAIAHKRLLDVTYNGTARIVEPHDYGVRNGKEQVFVYQLRPTGSQPGKKATPWKVFELPKIERCTVTQETFKGSRGTPGQRHHVWEILYARVE
jgi:hypothetical protein